MILGITKYSFLNIAIAVSMASWIIEGGSSISPKRCAIDRWLLGIHLTAALRVAGSGQSHNEDWNQQNTSPKVPYYISVCIAVWKTSLLKTQILSTKEYNTCITSTIPLPTCSHRLLLVKNAYLVCVFNPSSKNTMSPIGNLPQLVPMNKLKLLTAIQILHVLIFQWHQ